MVQIFQTESEDPLDELPAPDAESVSVKNEQKKTGKRSNSSRKLTGLRNIKHLHPGSYCSEVNRLLRELIFLSWFAQQKKEKRRLIIASLESLLPGSDGRLGFPAKHAKAKQKTSEAAPQTSEGYSVV